MGFIHRPGLPATRASAGNGIMRVLVVLLLAFACPVIAQPTGEGAGTQEEPDEDELSLEALMDMEVTSVAKKAQKVSRSAAAVYVITDEDIQRLGAQSVADALRVVPGLHVGSLSRSRWSISARGFGDEFANKLLTLMDGRTIYNPLFSGTYWSDQDLILQDVDRLSRSFADQARRYGARTP
ncbi:MAG: hypothetical protein CMJ83_16495 [Planctomycetes bacterium]|nr:hypothetical protein [Planctomycetota bacterium]